MISNATVDHTLVDIVVADPTRRWSAPLTKNSSSLEMRSGGRKPTIGIVHRTKFVPFALGIYGVLFNESDRFLVHNFRECAKL